MAKTKEKKKRGPPDHFTGFKHDFLVGYSAQFRIATDTKKTTEFYDRVTRKFIAKYGDDTKKAKENPGEDPPDPEDFEEYDALTAEQAAEKMENFKVIRKVSVTQTASLFHFFKPKYQLETIPMVS